MTDSATTLALLRRILMAVLLLGMTGTAVELLLLRHIEDQTQLIPLVLLGAGYLAVGWIRLRRSRLSLTALQIVMVLFVAAGALGLYFHYQANVEFQLEMEPQLTGGTLLWKVLQAKTPPALAPGVMVQLGLIGLAYAYRHPAAGRGRYELEEDRDDE